MSLPINGYGQGLYNSFSSQWNDYDKESPQWQFFKLLTKPEDVFRYIRSHRHENGHWARDNLKFALLEMILIFVLSFVLLILPGFQFSAENIFIAILQLIGINFIIFGLLASFLFTKFLNKFGLASRSYRESRQDVEFRFCFDAFCNGYTAIIADFLVGYPIIYLIGLVFSNSLFTLILPNTLLCFAGCHFLYLFIQTLNVLPFIKKLPYLLFWVPVILTYVLSMIFHWPIVRGWIFCLF